MTPKFAGMDGCKAGWIYVSIDRQGRYTFGVEPRFADAMRVLSHAELILVDMPIGLPSSGRPTRHCDVAARKAIAPRGSAVFPVPARSALSQASYEAACEANVRELGKKLSRQSWAIAPKIREVDDFLRKHRPGNSVREMHPEVAFWALNGEHALVEKKKKLAGERERLEILSRHFPLVQECYEACQREFPRSAVAKDDILDALVGAVTASHVPGIATFPANPVFDETGLPMEIVFAVAPPGTKDAPPMHYVELESAAAETVGRILFALTRFEHNLALALRFAQGNPGDEAFELWDDKLNFKGKLDQLNKIIEKRFGDVSECVADFSAWHDNMDLVRKKRNAFVHGRWGISSMQGRISNVSEDYPGVGSDGVRHFSLGSLRSELHDIERLAEEFARLQRRWSYFCL